MTGVNCWNDFRLDGSGGVHKIIKSHFAITYSPNIAAFGKFVRLFSCGAKFFKL